MNNASFDEADALVTRMLDQYNRLDYDLLLKRARIRQCQMKYEDAILDANLAHNILPQRVEAYHVLSEFLIALNDHQQALKLLEILNKMEDNPSVTSQYEMIKQNLSQKKPVVQSKQQTKMQKQISSVMGDYYKVIEKSQDGVIRAHIEKERNKRAKQVAESLAKGVGLPVNLFKKKKREIREKNNTLLQ